MCKRLEFYGIVDWLKPASTATVAEWVEGNVDLTDDTTSAWEGKVNLDETPHLIEPLNAWQDPAVRKITCMGPEQSNKSCTWQWGLLWKMANCPGPTLIVWRNIDEAKDMFSDRMLPIMRRIPRLAKQLERPGKTKKDRYDLGSMVLYNCGAGSPVLSKPCEVTIGDEVDFWQLAGRVANNSKVKGKADAKNVSNIKNLDKRSRTYPRTSKRHLVCSPTLPSGTIAQEYRESNQKHWNLACVNCSGLTPSHWTSPFKFRRNEAGTVIEPSIRWICRHCQHEHTEAEKRGLNRRGVACYVADRPEVVDHAGFQWSAMAVHWISWHTICTAIVKGGRAGSMEDQMYLDNSIRGMPFESRTVKAEERGKIESRCRVVDPEEIAMCMMAVDTQDLGFWWVVRGIDWTGNTHRLAHGWVDHEDQLAAIYDRPHAGRLCRYMIIDRGGHRSPEVDRLVARLPNAWSYHGRGNGGGQTLLAFSNEVHRCILANAPAFQHKLLFHLWKQTDERANFWYMGDPATLDEDYKRHILAVAPPDKNPEADISEWVKPDTGDHLFDCEKMWVILYHKFRDHIEAEIEAEAAAREKAEPGAPAAGASSLPAPSATNTPFVTPFVTGGWL